MYPHAEGMGMTATLPENVTQAESWSLNDDPQLDQAVINYRSGDPDSTMAAILEWCDTNNYRVVRYQCDIDQHWGQVVVARHDFPRPAGNPQDDPSRYLATSNAAIARVQYIATEIGAILINDDRGWVRVKNPYATARYKSQDGGIVSADI